MRIIIKILKLGLLVIAIPVLLAGSCRKNSTPCRIAPYSFSVTSNFSPEQEIYHVGDTIFLESVFPKVQTNLINSSMVDYSNSTDIGGGVGFGYIDTINRQVVSARDSFELVPIIGTFSEWVNNQNQGVNIKFVETSQTYHFKAAIICKKKGVYGFGVADLYSRGIRGKDCTNAGFIMTVSNTNKNLYLHQQYLGVDTNDAGLQRGGYDFRVQ